MTAIQLYKFINENSIEYSWIEDDVFIFLHPHNMLDFFNILPIGLFSDGGIECTMMHKYFAIPMADICSYSGIELTEIFKKED